MVKFNPNQLIELWTKVATGPPRRGCDNHPGSQSRLKVIRPGDSKDYRAAASAVRAAVWGWPGLRTVNIKYALN